MKAGACMKPDLGACVRGLGRPSSARPIVLLGMAWYFMVINKKLARTATLQGRMLLCHTDSGAVIGENLGSYGEFMKAIHYM